MNRPASLFRSLRSVGMVPALAGLAAAQDGSVILKRPDQLEKRVPRMEAEMGHFRKAASPEETSLTEGKSWQRKT